ncbi:MAG: beta-phosphoglucomutase [Prolixibacteraceae bacterium]|nr:beta-phosphoglucomutase [Prolixibacteraceae bacterium]
MEIEACIFDLDGVIVDTAKYHYLAWKELAAGLGFEFTRADNERLKGVSRMTSLNILIEIGGITLNDEQKEKLAAQKNAQYVSYIRKMSPDEILPGVTRFLDELKAAGIKTAVGSASKNTPLILERLKLIGYFDAVVDGNKVSKAKPDPEVFLKGAEELAVHPKNCVVFEDAPAGVKAALNAGMECIGIGLPENLPGAKKVIPGFDNFQLSDLKKIVHE